MVILGGLEIVVGGYLIHRYHKNKNEKKRLEEEAQQRRHNTFPGAKPHAYPHQRQQPPVIPPQKYACYGPSQPQPPPQSRPQPRPYASQPAPHTQSFAIPRRPVPQQQPQSQRQMPSLQRSDSMATISRMPIANGYRPSDVPDDNPPLPPRRQQSGLLPIPQREPMSSPYSNASFSVSTPALDPPSMSPVTYTPSQPPRRSTVDDNWETYNPRSPHVHFAPSHHGGDEEDDPPPPYQP